MPNTARLQRFVDDELSRAPLMIDRILAGTIKLLRDAQDSTLVPSQRRSHGELIDALQQDTSAYQQAVANTLQWYVAQATQTPSAASEALKAQIDIEGATTLDEGSADLDIETWRAMQLIGTTAEWELRELQSFTSTLAGLQHVAAESNPFRPLAYANALRNAACCVTTAGAQRTLLLKISSGVAAGLLKNAWAAACTRLEAQGIEPGIFKTVLMTPEMPTGHGTLGFASTRAGTLTDLLSNMPGGADTFRLDIGRVGSMAGSAAGTSAKHGIGRALSPSFNQALAELAAFLEHLPPPTVTDPERSVEIPTFIQQLGPFRSALVEQTSMPIERQVIELVSHVVDAVLRDPLIAPTFQIALARLHAAVLQVALREPDLLDSHRHPVWQLFDRVDTIASLYPHLSDRRGAAALQFFWTLTNELVVDPTVAASSFTSVLQQVDQFMAEHLRAQTQTAHLTCAALRLSEQRAVLQQHLSRQLESQLASLEIKSSIQTFVTQTWALVIAESVLRHGEGSEETHGYLAWVDQLLWSLRLPNHPKYRKRLLIMLPGLLTTLRKGMALIALPQPAQDLVLNELMAIHTEALRPGGGTHTSAAASPEELVQNMRDELLLPATSQAPFSESAIDVASIEAAPIASARAPSAAAAPRPKTVDSLKPGNALRLFIHGRWMPVQLLWRSDHGLYFLFATGVAGVTQSITREALERLADAGLLQALVEKPLLDRALDRLMRDQARASQ